MRSKRIDIIKGIGIILVVLGHTQIRAEGFFSLFHVALFFIAAGFCYSDKYTASVQALKEYLKKTVIRLYVPYVAFNLVYLLLRNPLNIVGVYENAAIRFPAMLHHAGKILLLQKNEYLVGPCWFVRVLLMLRALFAGTDFICKKISEKHIWWFRTGISVAFLLLGDYFNRKNTMMVYDFPVVCSVYILYTFGLLFKKMLQRPRIGAALRSVKWDICSLVLGLAVLLYINRNAVIQYVFNEYPNIPVFLAAAISGWCVCWALAGLLEKQKGISGALVYLGERTMSIMMLHLTGFLLVSVIGILVNQLPWECISSEHVITADWWPAYFAAGMLFPILLDKIWDRGERNVKLLTRKQILAVLTVVLLVVNAWIFGKAYGKEELQQVTLSDEEANLNFSLVYDKDYYLQKYPDLEEAFAGASDLDVFLHFKNHGMKEGRQAIAGFDPYYYRQVYPDLWAAYGDDMEKYYLHYMIWGYIGDRDGNFEVK